MKRFHVHVAVPDLQASIRFYSTLFAAEPTVRKDDYAKWMLDDPRINFAISTGGPAGGVDHLGFQLESSAELRSMEAQLQAADQGMTVEKNADCCYARSDKYWVTDPSGIAWETFHTLSGAPVFGGQAAAGAAFEAASARTGCGCAPRASGGGQACCA
ncbi:MAG TPA: ArsI/CadI family heavy metal resistance metalloenzyme [Casimicrobiaceae bacterium]|jgi:lactoylglutathione lyase